MMGIIIPIVFHLSTINRRSNNRIHTLRDGSGVWIEDHGLLSDHITNHFKSLFTTDHVMDTLKLSTSELGNMHFPVINSDCHVTLCSPPSISELWIVVPLNLESPRDRMVSTLHFLKNVGQLCLPPLLSFSPFGLIWVGSQLSLIRISFVSFQKFIILRLSINLDL